MLFGQRKIVCVAYGKIKVCLWTSFFFSVLYPFSFRNYSEFCFLGFIISSREIYIENRNPEPEVSSLQTDASQLSALQWAH